MLEKCKNTPYIQPPVIIDAALGLCGKLRRELDDVKLLNKSYELKSNRLSPEHTSLYSSTYSKYNRNSKKKNILIIIYLLIY